MPDYFESPPPVSDPERSLTDDIEVGSKKASSAPLTSAPGFERRAIIAAVVFQLLILVTMILGKTVPYLVRRRSFCTLSRSTLATCFGAIT